MSYNLPDGMSAEDEIFDNHDEDEVYEDEDVEYDEAKETKFGFRKYLRKYGMRYQK